MGARAGVVLLDEPTANLDRSARIQVIESIGSLCAGGASVLISAHDRELIALPGARRVHLAAGRVAESSATLTGHPDTG